MATILLIDPEASARVTLAVALEAAGHHVLSAADRREGLRLLDDQVVDLILMDLPPTDPTVSLATYVIKGSEHDCPRA